MWKKRALGLAILVAGILVWSCGDGSVDSLSDNELIMVTRFPSTIDYDMLDRVIDACKQDKECWEKAKKSGEIYKGDFTKILRDSSGNIIIQQGDSAYIWKDGKKLPVFDFSSNSKGDDDDDVTTSGSKSTASSSSSKRSGNGGFDVDEGDGAGDDLNSAGSGTGNSSRAHVQSSSSKKGSGKSSSSNASQYTNPSSSSLGTYTGSTSSNSRSSTSVITISANSVAQSSSSPKPIHASAASGTSTRSSSSNNGSAPSSASAKLCGDKAIEGTCTPNKNSVALNEQVTWTYIPDSGTCSDGNIEWQSLNDGNIKGDDSQILTADGTLKQSGGLSFVVAFSTAEKKEQTIFFMDGKRFNCLPVTVSSP